MNPNIWNIKDMFSVPPGAGLHKSANQNTLQSDHSSLSGSQLLFSSQFCPDNSQQGCTDYNTKYQRNSNQNSQDATCVLTDPAGWKCLPEPQNASVKEALVLHGVFGHMTTVESEPSVYQKYQAKPPLCSNDPKERITFQPFGPTKDIIEQFEESKRKAKEKHESEQLNQLICNIHGTLQDLKVPFFNIEENTNLRCQSILDSVNAVFKALKEQISSFHESMLKVVPLKSHLEQAKMDLEKKIQQNDVEMTDLKSKVQLLLMALDVIKSQQSEKHLELSASMQSSEERILHEIRKSKLVSLLACSSKDKTTQTSPVSDLSVIERLTSQCKTSSTCPDGPSPSPDNVLSTCGGISSRLSAENRGNPCVTEVKGRKTFNVTSAGNVGSSLADQRRWRNAISMDDTAETSAPNLQHLCQDDGCIPLFPDNLPRNTCLHSEKENRVIATRSKGKYNGPRINKRRRNLKKTRTKNTTQAAVSPAPLKETQKKSLTFSLVRSQRIIEASEIKGASLGGQCEVPWWDGSDPDCTKISEWEEDRIAWFASSSPFNSYSSTYPAQKRCQEDLMTLFFDSSDDND